MTGPRTERLRASKQAMIVALLVAAAALTAGLSTARATIQEESCIYPDVEYPMPCDDDD